MKRNVLQLFSAGAVTETTDKPLRGMNFVLSGAFSSCKKKPVTHSSLKKIIVEKGGTVKDFVPDRTKSVSEKKYVVISSRKKHTEKSTRDTASCC